MLTKGGKRYVFWGFLCVLLVLFPKTTAKAENGKTYLDTLNAGVAAIIDPSVVNPSLETMSFPETIGDVEIEEESKLVMANVQSVLNVREEPTVDSNRVGFLYRDCGGVILEKGDGWTKIQTGNLIGWCSNDYLFFGDEAEAVANQVGTVLACNDNGAFRLRTEPDADAPTLGFVARGEDLEVISISEDNWVCLDYEGKNGYVLSEYVDVRFQIDHGETLAEIAAREKAEKEAKKRLITNYGAATVGADDTRLLAALIQCEAGGEGYEGQLAVGAVVMNRVRSGAYPNNVYGVIYASGQFTPALNGKVDAVYLSGNIRQSCIKAAEDAIAGNTNVGAACHFRRNNGTRDGVVIGNQVFF